MFDPNGIICTQIATASLELLGTNEIRKLSVVRVNSTSTFENGMARRGGLHDPRMGPLEAREHCETCGCRNDCPGHLGHIDLAMPVFNVALLPSLVKLLKITCMRCKRLRLDPRSAALYVKKFELIQHDMLEEIEWFEALTNSIQNTGTGKGRMDDTFVAEKRIQMMRAFKKIQEKTQLKLKQEGEVNLSADISFSSSTVESWGQLRKDFLATSATRKVCSHCCRTYNASIRLAKFALGIDVSWPKASERPFSKSTWRRDEASDTFQMDGESDVDEDTDEIIHGRRGKESGFKNFQAYQMLNLMRSLWASPDRQLLEFLYPISHRVGWEMFFIQALPVSANKFRPLMKSSVGDMSTLHTRTAALMEIMSASEKLQFALGVLRQEEPLAAIDDPDLCKDPNGIPIPDISEGDKERLRKLVKQHAGNFQLLETYTKLLQEKVNVYIDKTKAPKPDEVGQGVRQWMEKKQGAIRQKMMGKRVNYAARTVIAPDCLINTNEIGIPVPFAKKLTIPEYVTPHNAAYLSKLVENGTAHYPGAVMMQSGDGSTFNLSKMPERVRRTKARLLFSEASETAKGGAPRIVYRNVRDGDIVLMNRQPSLHKPSMMAHFVRVLPGQKTFRMHYVNCGTYNADFDGDEMNLHCPQDPMSRVEAQLIANADCQYNVPKNGDPLRGLIQDHVLGGNFLTCRGTFLTRHQYHTLLYTALGEFVDRGTKVVLEPNTVHKVGNKAEKVNKLGVKGFDPYARFLSSTNIQMHVEPPAVLKPEVLWTGKQVITSLLKTLVDNVAIMTGKAKGPKAEEYMKGYKGFNFTSKSKTPGDAWGGVLDGDTEESTVIIQDSELLQGVIDKGQFGATSHGLVHLCYELLGPRVAGMLLGVFARLGTCWLQMRGFSCCTGDFLMTPEGELAREKMVLHCTVAGNYLQEVFVDAVNRQMKWKEEIEDINIMRKKFKTVANQVDRLRETEGREQLLASASERRRLDHGIGIDGLAPEGPRSGGAGSLSKFPHGQKVDYGFFAEIYAAGGAAGVQAELEKLGVPMRLRGDVVRWVEGRYKVQTQRPSAASDDVETEAHEASSKVAGRMDGQTGRGASGDAASSREAAVLQTRDLLRSLHIPYPGGDWRGQGKDAIMKEIVGLIKQVKLMGKDNKRVQRRLLELMSTTPEIALHFPKASKLLGTHKMWGPGILKAINDPQSNSLLATPPPPRPGAAGPPTPNKAHVLPGGGVVLGDGSRRTPATYFPSWLWHEEATQGLNFMDPLRYASRMVQVKDRAELRAAELNLGKKAFCSRPNELTRMRMEMLATKHFAGKEETLVRMLDGFFQSGMRKITSKNNDLVSGNVTLFKFPQNGFSSMITTGAKGSKVNFAMICGMLSQQSLEGRRVPVMVSGRTLPSFAKYDFGARAGGLITDRYLTGLRPQEYFFHCMAGREGLVDTAVKTARSGYLQRCVVKGLEGIRSQYDGTVRDSDGTVIQFLYGEDGLDVTRSTFIPKLTSLLENYDIIRARYLASVSGHPTVISSTALVSEFCRRQKALQEEIAVNPLHQIGLVSVAASASGERDARDESESAFKLHSPPIMGKKAVEQESGTVDRSKPIERKFHPLDPVTSVFPPTCAVGSVSEGYSKLVNKAVEDMTAKWLKKRTTKFTEAELLEYQKELRTILSLKYADSLCAPGEAVGCLAAQSMGEPATQMTLNTFHLAGHGAANVTLGIPRLREILQTAGKAGTPFLYLPIQGETPDTAAKHAEQILMGFRKILLTDVVHALGVEGAVYYQPETANGGHPGYRLGVYKDSLDSYMRCKRFWQYEMTLQLENLDHFCEVVPRYTPQKIINLIVNRALKDIMRQVSKLMFLYAHKHADEEFDSEDDELEVVADRYIFGRDCKTQMDRKIARKARAKIAGAGFGVAPAGGAWGAAAGGDGDADLLTNVEVAGAFKKGRKAEDDEGANAGRQDREEDEAGGGEETVAADKGDGDGTGDVGEEEGFKSSDHERDDSETDYAGSELADDEEKAVSDAGELEGDEPVDAGEEPAAPADVDMNLVKTEDAEEEDLADESATPSPASASPQTPTEGSGSPTATPKAERVKAEEGTASSSVQGLSPTSSRRHSATLAGVSTEDSPLKYNRKRRVLDVEKLPRVHGDPLPDSAMWDTAEGAAYRVKQLPEDVYRFLTHLKVCRKTWTITAKFGWPVEKCPRRVNFLDAFVKIIKKYKLQDTPGVGNPRIVGGDFSETKSNYEIQCEGSNFRWIHQLKDSCIDHNRVTSNDIKAVIEAYGIEAGRQSIMRELCKVFGVYGITVDFRHLSLIGDAMTHSGKFRPFSRIGVAYHSSPLLQMSFETSMKFLTDAVERGAHDSLDSPAGAIICGKNAAVGTGMTRCLARFSAAPSRSKSNVRFSNLDTRKSRMPKLPSLGGTLLEPVKEEVEETSNVGDLMPQGTSVEKPKKRKRFRLT